MQVELLYFDGCPNWRAADERLRVALAQAGREDVCVRHRRVTTPQQADAVGFHGSPTILVDGLDPFAESSSPVSLSCRIYPTEAGLTGSPTVEQLLAVLS